MMGERGKTGRGRTNQRASQSKSAKSQAPCVTAIECGANAAKTKSQATIKRSSQRAAFDRSGSAGMMLLFSTI
jgi:hypothetical protein